MPFHLFYRPKDEETTINLQLIDTQLEAFVGDTRIDYSFARELCLQLDLILFPLLSASYPNTRHPMSDGRSIASIYIQQHSKLHGSKPEFVILRPC